jgi:hypothetical protein
VEAIVDRAVVIRFRASAHGGFASVIDHFAPVTALRAAGSRNFAAVTRNFAKVNSRFANVITLRVDVIGHFAAVNGHFADVSRSQRRAKMPYVQQLMNRQRTYSRRQDDVACHN